MIYFETKRLLATSYTEADLPHFSAMNSDKEIMRYFPNTLTHAESLAQICAIQKEIDTVGYGLFAIRMKENDQFIGFTGLHQITFQMDFTPATEISWRLARSHWNQGLATEAALAVIQFAKTKTDLKELYSLTAKLNKSSIRVMEKVGLSYEKTFFHPQVDPISSLQEHVLYHIQL
ncbi:GNAT family N-acetyltransferase [Listeria sp. PSOL-1]|uniref:GNAT family N-acetyltransferase n=1 Tax=Listeria sp. PSOL-1 TaxID=1844999 RepID=UPI0013D3704B|nr:GNAT family N-acetyltransferase [Listeria sp. PSOL-1]